MSERLEDAASELLEGNCLLTVCVILTTLSELLQCLFELLQSSTREK